MKPAQPGLIVLDPVTYRRLPPEGGEVPETTYWRRRLRAGDVVKVESARPAAASPRRAPPAQE